MHNDLHSWTVIYSLPTSFKISCSHWYTTGPRTLSNVMIACKLYIFDYRDILETETENCLNKNTRYHISLILQLLSPNPKNVTEKDIFINSLLWHYSYNTVAQYHRLVSNTHSGSWNSDFYLFCFLYCIEPCPCCCIEYNNKLRLRSIWGFKTIQIFIFHYIVLLYIIYLYIIIISLYYFKKYCSFGYSIHGRMTLFSITFVNDMYWTWYVCLCHYIVFGRHNCHVTFLWDLQYH